MAVKPITNKQVVSTANINRGKETSTRNKVVRGNRETTITPGRDFTNNYWWSICFRSNECNYAGLLL